MSEEIDSYKLCESTQRRLKLVSSGIASLIGTIQTMSMTN